MKTPIPSTLTSKMMISGLLFVMITPWSIVPAPAKTESLGVQARFQSAGGSRFFPQTGKSVSGDFLEAFDRYGVALAGWPISDELVEGGLKVQYFERMRMERHSDLASRGTIVRLTRLGAEMAPQEHLVPVQAFSPTAGRLFFPQTGHSLEAPFLKFWRDRGGLELFGYPISEPVWVDGLKVQWFERARMEHHPQLVSQGWGVQLTRLGNLAWAKSSSNTRSSAAPNTRPAGVEKSLLDMINNERARAGAARVASLPELADLAHNRSADMAARNYFSHTTPEGTNVFDMLRTLNIRFSYAGEILSKSTAQDNGYATQLALHGFLNSPGHKEILLNSSYTHASAGYARAADGTNYFTVVFVQR